MSGERNEGVFSNPNPRGVFASHLGIPLDLCGQKPRNVGVKSNALHASGSDFVNPT